MRIRVYLCSPSWREKLVANLDVELDDIIDGIESEQLAEVNQEGDELHIWGRRDGKPWVFKFDDLVEALSNARAHLG